MPITLSPPLPHAEAAARAGFPSVSAHISQKTCLADWLMMTDGRCAGALRQFAHPVYCGAPVYSTIRHFTLVGLQMLESCVCQAPATSYRKTINLNVFLNILSSGLNGEVKTSEPMIR